MHSLGYGIQDSYFKTGVYTPEGYKMNLSEKLDTAIDKLDNSEKGGTSFAAKVMTFVFIAVVIACGVVSNRANANSVMPPAAVYNCGGNCILPAPQPPETDMAYSVEFGVAERSSSTYQVPMGKPISVDIASTDECFVSISPFNSGKSLTKVANYHLYSVEVDIQAIGAGRGMCLPEVKHTLKLACGTKKVSIDLTFFDTCQHMVRPKK